MNLVMRLRWCSYVPSNALNPASTPHSKLSIIQSDSSTSPHHGFAAFGPGFHLKLGSGRPLSTIRLVMSPWVITAPAAGGAACLNCSASFPPRFRQHSEQRGQPVGADQNTNNGQEAQKAQVRKTRIWRYLTCRWLKHHRISLFLLICSSIITWLEYLVLRILSVLARLRS